MPSKIGHVHHSHPFDAIRISVEGSSERKFGHERTGDHYSDNRINGFISTFNEPQVIEGA